MFRRRFLTNLVAGAALVRTSVAQQQSSAGGIFLERPVSGQPHQGKVLLAVQAHSDDIPLSASGNSSQVDRGRVHRPSAARYE